MARRTTLLLCLLIVAGLHPGSAPLAADLAEELRQLDAATLTGERREAAADQVNRWIERERLAAIARENALWRQVQSREQWEAFRDQRISALRDSLGQPREDRSPPAFHVADRREGSGFVVENIVYESRPGLWVSANLYRPAAARQAMPSILISHSHHNPKSQGELQTMGITWARQGCVVLVPDHLGHGERRQHPFASADDYPGDFRRGRQDYYFRYNVNLQLRAVGESLMGYLVHDLRRGVDLLESLEGVDRNRTVLIGAVAGGGDPAGVAAALDPRIEAAVPFNFGGPQPDYGIPARAEQEFYYFGVAYWEQTRCLPLGGRDGFAHWLIVAAIAPRGLIYSHEFSWDRERDPVWPRLERVYSFYDAPARLAAATGKGSLKGSPPDNTHCNNVGAYHRRGIYPHLQQWFQMPIPGEEAQPQFGTDELACFTPAVVGKIDNRPVNQLAREMADEQIAAARACLAEREPDAQRQWLRSQWTRLLGDTQPPGMAKVIDRQPLSDKSLQGERLVLETGDQILVPLLILHSRERRSGQSPMAVVVARDGKQALLKQRADSIAQLLSNGWTVCLPDLRESGETRSGNDLSRGSHATTLSCRAQVLGKTLLGARLSDLRAVLDYLHSRDDAPATLALWGESLAEVNPPQRSERLPMAIDNPNVFGEPGAGLLALLAALFDDRVDRVASGGSYNSFRTLFDSQFLYIPHDTVIAGATAAGDVDDLVSSLAPRTVLRHSAIDALNRAAADAQPADAAEWFVEQAQLER